MFLKWGEGRTLNKPTYISREDTEEQGKDRRESLYRMSSLIIFDSSAELDYPQILPIGFRPPSLSSIDVHQCYAFPASS